MNKLFACFVLLKLVLHPIAQAADPGANAKDSSFDPGKLMDLKYVLKNVMEKSTLSMALSATGSTFDVRCPDAPKYLSTLTYQTASTVHVGWEIFNTNYLSQNHQKKSEDLKLLDSKIEEARARGEVQRESLKTALDEEQETLRYVREKKKWMTGIMAGQLAATGYALAESLIELAKLGTSGADAIGVGSAAAGSGGYQGVITAPMIVWTALMAKIGDLGIHCKVNPAPPLAVGAEIIAGYAFMKNDPGYREFTTVLSANITGISTVTPIAYDFAISRSVAFGAHAALTKLIIDDLSEQEKVLESNIKKLQDALANLGGNEGPGPGEGPGVASGGSQSNNGAQGGQGDLLYGSQGGRHCLSSGESGALKSSSDCSSPLKIGRPGSKLDLGVTTFDDSLAQLGQTAEAVVNGQMEKGSAIAGQLGSNASRLRSLNGEIKKRINKLLKEKGKDQIDFDKEEKDMVSYFQKEGGAAKGGGQFPSTANTNANNEYRAALDKAPETRPTDKIKVDAAVAEPDKAPAGNPFKNIGRGYKDIAPASASKSDYTSSGEGIDNFETNEADISVEKQVSIFKIISHRYNMSHEKLMKRKHKD